MFCQPPVEPLPPMFDCINNIASIPYTLVCDHRPDCSDHSDEDFCIFPECSASMFHCGNHQCISRQQSCDMVDQCLNGADELQCERKMKYIKLTRWYSPLHPSLVDFTGLGNFTFSTSEQKLRNWTGCPETHFLCPRGLYYCLPVYVRCNGVDDCPYHEDEMSCDTYTCPGFYSCRGSHVCVHFSHLCDGVFHCQQRDDELFCNQTCPDECVCYGFAFFCSSRVQLDGYSDLRFLEARGSGLTPLDLDKNAMLIHVGLSSCGLVSLELPKLNNLKTLDLSDNYIPFINLDQLAHVLKLSTLKLAGNPLAVPDFFIFSQVFPSLYELDLSRIQLKELNTSNLVAFSNLKTVNLSNSIVESITVQGFQPFRKLRQLELRGCPLTHFPHDVFKGLNDLRAISADNYKICCPEMLPEGFNLKNCVAPSDEISSCQTLLRSNIYRVLLVIFGTSALVCNLTSFVFRVMSETSAKSGFRVFVIHLCVSDFLMGIYLAIIGVADQLYHGNYPLKDIEWRHSATCQMAGFLSLLSCEVSAFIICLITLDRFLVLRFPFSRLHFNRKSSYIACAVIWFLGLILATIPLLPFNSHWKYYSQTGICIPLPITRKAFPGQKYSFNIMIILNFILFLLIAIGQLIIYLSIKASSLSTFDANRQSKDQTIARRLITVAMSDFLCWFPVGLLGLLAANNVPIPGEVNVSISIIVLPLNSALNPFLYTLNLILERRRCEKEAQLFKRLTAQQQRKTTTSLSASSVVDKLNLSYSVQEVQTLLEKWVADGSLSKEQLNNIAKNK